MADREGSRGRVRIEGPTTEDMMRLRAALAGFGDSKAFELWVAETRLTADRTSARRLLVATWVLAVSTIGLVAATAGLIYVTLHS